MIKIKPVTDKKARKANWPGIKAEIKGWDSTKQLSIIALRRLYIDGELPDLEQRKGSDVALMEQYQTQLFLRLMLEPESSSEDWEHWEIDIKCETLIAMFHLFANPSRYTLSSGYAQNSLYAGREMQIFDFFFKDAIKNNTAEMESHARGSQGRSETKATDAIHLPLRHLTTHLSRHDINRYSPRWRTAEYLTQYLLSSPDNAYEVNSGSDIYYGTKIQKIALPICAFEWCSRSSNDYDSHIKKVVDDLRAAFDDERTHPAIRETYHTMVSQEMDSYIEFSAVGGTYSVLIQYDTAEQLEAMIPLLTPETRYPFTPETYGSVYTPFPPENHNKNNRTSYRGLLSLWDIGFKASRVEVVDSCTLFVEYSGMLKPSFSLTAIEVLRSNMVNFLEKMKARKIHADDDSYKNPRFKTLYLVSPSAGRKRICAIPRGQFHDSVKATRELYHGNVADVDKHLDSNTDSIEILQVLMREHFDCVLDKGSKIDRRWSMENSL